MTPICGSLKVATMFGIDFFLDNSTATQLEANGFLPLAWLVVAGNYRNGLDPNLLIRVHEEEIPLIAQQHFFNKKGNSKDPCEIIQVDSEPRC